MRLRGLRAVGWRNLAPLHLTLDSSARVCVLFGDNGQGKTNVIEALFYLSAFRSFRTTRPLDLVQRGSQVAQISVESQSRSLERSVEAQLVVRQAVQATGIPVAGLAVEASRGAAAAPGGVLRKIVLDSKPVRGVAGAFGVFSVVLFVPEDLMLVRAAPAARRRFVDMAISGVEPSYFAEAARFQRILRSRNAVLRARRTSDVPELLDTFDEQLAQAGARVVIRRRALIEELAPGVDVIFRRLHGDLAVGLRYVSEPGVAIARSEGEVSAALLAGLRRRRVVDERRGHTTFGPQTDDLEISLAERPAREHASQGQTRTLVLAMKLAELAHVESRRGEAPVLLLDDVPSELDPTRRRHLFETLAALPGQTVVSVADPSLVPALAGRVDFHVEGGRLNPVPVFPLLAGS